MPLKEFTERRQIPLECSMAIAEGLQNGLAIGIKQGVIDAFKELSEDKEFLDKASQGIFNRVVKHSSDGAKTWVGGRVITWLATVLFLALLGYLIRSGAFK